MRVVFEVVLRVVLRLFEGCCLRVGFEKKPGSSYWFTIGRWDESK